MLALRTRNPNVVKAVTPLIFATFATDWLVRRYAFAASGVLFILGVCG